MILNLWWVIIISVIIIDQLCARVHRPFSEKVNGRRGAGLR